MSINFDECPYCKGTILDGEFCNFCVTNYEKLPDPKTMSGQARQEELRMLLFSPICIPISMLTRRVNSLVGRKVTYGEFTFNWKGLLREAYNNNLPE